MTQSTVTRRNMAASQLFPHWVHDKRVLEAMYDTPREAFVPEALKGVAYGDEDLPLGNGRSLIAPNTLARLLELANIWEDDRVLVVGALAGYAAAVVSELSNHVTMIENDAAAVAQAKNNFMRLGIGHIDAQTVASLADGYTKNAPYDVVVLCGAVQTIPESLAAQMKEGGCLVAVRNVASRPGSSTGLGKAMLVKRIDSQLQYRECFDAATTLLNDFVNQERFTF